MLNFLEKLFDWSNLYSFEKAVLEAVLSHMDDETRLKLKRQIEVVNNVQRLSDGKEVNLYRTRFGRVTFDDRLRIANAPPELLLARVDLGLPNKKPKLTAKVWMAEGRLFSLEFNIAPSQFFAGISLRDTRPEIVDVNIFHEHL